MDPTESQIQSAICVYLDSIPGVVYSITNASGSRNRKGRWLTARCKEGWPDITGCLPSGRFFAIEVKARRGVLSKEQETIHGRLRASGALMVVARCVLDVSNAFWEQSKREKAWHDHHRIC